MKFIFPNKKYFYLYGNNLMMAQKTKEKESIGNQIKSHFTKNQSWLSQEIGMSEAQLSRKLNGTKDWTQEDLDKINKVLGTSFKL